jgi:hypothetical protein
MAVLNSEIQNPLALVQIGIAAPALITSFVSGTALNQSQRPVMQAMSIVSSAEAAELNVARPIVFAAFFNDVLNGLTPGLGVQPPRKLTGAEILGAFVGNTVYTAGRFGAKTNIIHYDTDGTIKLISPDVWDAGTYKVSDDGVFCTKYRLIRDGSETCQTIYQVGPSAYEFHLPNGTILKATVEPGVK